MKKWEAKSSLLLHTQVWWLSRDEVLVWPFILQNEVMLSPPEFSINLLSLLCNSQGSQCLSYLTDIFSTLNELNLSCQSTFETVYSAYDKTEANVKKKFSFGNSVWRKKLLSASLHFMIFVSEFELPLSSGIASEITEHLKYIQTSIT